jgi:hypothetical protein
MARQTALVLPTPWPRPQDVDLQSGGEIRWHGSGPVTSVEDPRDLAALLDDFVRIARPDARPDGLTYERTKLVSFYEQFGPWGACTCGRVHGELSRDMPHLGPIPEPPRRAIAAPPANHQSFTAGLWSAARANAIRALVVRGRLPETLERAMDRPLFDRAILPLVSLPGMSDGSVVSEVRRLVGSAQLSDQFARDVLDRWLLSCHVVASASGWLPTSGLISLRVGGLAGAIAVAVLAERSARLRTAICGRCATTWTVWREWNDSLAIGAGLCKACQASVRGARWRGRATTSPQGQEDDDA